LLERGTLSGEEIRGLCGPRDAPVIPGAVPGCDRIRASTLQAADNSSRISASEKPVTDLVADALLKHGTLDGDAVTALC
jgi:hypothetical protein